MTIKIDGDTEIFGLLGSQISYTKSPAMHNRAIKCLGYNRVYLPLQINENTLAGFLTAAQQMNFGGFNVTQPLKEVAAQLVDAGAKQSVNTIVKTKDGWRGESTDGIGFARGLQRLQRDLDSFEEVVVLGAGGAVTAILEHISATQSQFPTVTILRRSALKDQELRTAYAGPIDFLELSLEHLRTVLAGKGAETLFVQASSAPLKGDDLQAFVPALAEFNGVLCDLIYNKPSKLYFAALSANLAAIDGEPMLIEQARASQKLWWGKNATYEDMLQALRGK